MEGVAALVQQELDSLDGPVGVDTHIGHASDRKQPLFAPLSLAAPRAEVEKPRSHPIEDRAEIGVKRAEYARQGCFKRGGRLKIHAVILPLPDYLQIPWPQSAELHAAAACVEQALRQRDNLCGDRIVKGQAFIRRVIKAAHFAPAIGAIVWQSRVVSELPAHCQELQE